jgi:hypothetical protein
LVRPQVGRVYDPVTVAPRDDTLEQVTVPRESLGEKRVLAIPDDEPRAGFGLLRLGHTGKRQEKNQTDRKLANTHSKHRHSFVRRASRPEIGGNREEMSG